MFLYDFLFTPLQFFHSFRNTVFLFLFFYSRSWSKNISVSEAAAAAAAVVNITLVVLVPGNFIAQDLSLVGGEVGGAAWKKRI